MKKILIVEDESIIALNLKYDLEDLGYEVIDIVDTGDDAIDKAVEYRPNLTVMDINLKDIDLFIEENKENILRDIARLVAVPSIEGEPEEGAPFGKEPKKALELGLEIAEELGTCYKAYRCYEKNKTESFNNFIQHTAPSFL